MLKSSEETIEISEQIESKLNIQNENLDIVIEKLDSIETNSLRAKKEVENFFKSLWADKIIMIIIIFIIIIGICVVVYKIGDILCLWNYILSKECN